MDPARPLRRPTRRLYTAACIWFAAEIVGRRREGGLTRWAMGVAEHGGHGGCESSSHCPGVELDGQYVRPGWVLQFRTGQGGSVPDVHTPWLLQVIVLRSPCEAKTAVRVLPLKTAESLLPVTVPRAVRQEPAGSVMVMSQPTQIRRPEPHWQ